MVARSGFPTDEESPRYLQCAGIPAYAKVEGNDVQHVQKLALQLRLLTEEYLEIVKEVLPVRAAVAAAEQQRQGA